MKYLTVLLNSILLTIVGCSAEADTPNENTQDNYTISLANGVLTVNSEHIHLPQPIDDIVEKIGLYNRFAHHANDIYTWDDHGFIFWSKPKKKTANQIGIYVRKKPKADYLNYVENYVDSRPKQDFNGTFLLDGATITQNMTFETLNAKKSGPKFNGTHWADKFKYYAKHPVTGQSYRVIVYLHKDRTIEYVEIVYEEKVDGSDKNNK